MKAFSIGKTEAAAVSQLQASVEPSTLKVLKESVSKRGMKSFLSHEVISKGYFSSGFASASGCSESWVSVTTNLEDGALATRSIV